MLKDAEIEAAVGHANKLSPDQHLSLAKEKAGMVPDDVKEQVME